MEEVPLFITSYCHLWQQKVILDGELVYQSDAALSLPDHFREFYRHLGADYPKFHKMDSLCKPAFLAAELLARKQPLWQTNTAFVLSNRTSSWLADNKHAQTISGGNAHLASPANFVYTLPNIMMGEISIRHQILSEQVFFIFNKFTPNMMVPYIRDIIHGQRAPQVLAGWVEVTESMCDVFLYLVSATGTWPHTIQNVEKLYRTIYE